MSPRSDDRLLGRTIGGKFEVVSKLGEGGFSAVYKAVQPIVGRTVALKVLFGDATQDPEMRGRFFREARAVASLTHPAIVKMHDYGEEPDGLLFIAFEFVQGRSLTQAISAEAPFTTARAVDLLLQASSALIEAHEIGLVHRDLKPDNLMVVAGPLGEEKLRILDFGISKQLKTQPGVEDIATRAGIVLGTPRYMSPEQARNLPLDERSDLYSLGVIAYELLTGKPPFTHTSPLELLMAHIADPVPPIPTGLGIPPHVANAVMKTLNKLPEQRFAHAKDFAQALSPAAAPAPARVVEPPPTEKVVLPAATTPPEGVAPEPDEDDEPVLRPSRAGLYVVLVVVLLGAAAAVWYVNRERPPQVPMEPVRQNVTVSARPEALEPAARLMAAGKKDEAAAALIAALQAAPDRAALLVAARGDVALAPLLERPDVKAMLP